MLLARLKSTERGAQNEAIEKLSNATENLVTLGVGIPVPSTV